MKKLYFVALVLLVGLVGCDTNSSQETDVTDNTPVAEMTDSSAVESSEDSSMITPGDISEEAQTMMYKTIYDYNQCMVANRLSTTQDGQSVQQAANAIMDSCEVHLDGLEAHLLANKVNEPLVIGMTKSMRGRAARKLMTQGMNQMAAQASAAANANAEQMEAEQQ